MKNTGIPFHVFEEALMHSKGKTPLLAYCQTLVCMYMCTHSHLHSIIYIPVDARLRILDIMDECVSTPRAELKNSKPAQSKLATFNIDTSHTNIHACCCSSAHFFPHTVQ